MLLKYLLKTVENIGLCSRVFIFLDSKCNNILGIAFCLYTEVGVLINNDASFDHYNK